MLFGLQLSDSRRVFSRANCSPPDRRTAEACNRLAKPLNEPEPFAILSFVKLAAFRSIAAGASPPHFKGVRCIIEPEPWRWTLTRSLRLRTSKRSISNPAPTDAIETSASVPGPSRVWPILGSHVLASSSAQLDGRASSALTPVTAHHCSRQVQALGHTGGLLPPSYVAQKLDPATSRTITP
jgi:hypothetical protein